MSEMGAKMRSRLVVIRGEIDLLRCSFVVLSMWLVVAILELVLVMLISDVVDVNWDFRWMDRRWGQEQLPLTIALFGCWENLGLFLPASSFIALEGGGRFVVEEDRDELFAYVLAPSLWTR